MRILVLHGYGQNATSFLNKGKIFWDSLRNCGWEVEAADAPFLLYDQRRSWLKSAKTYEGLEESLKLISTYNPDFLIGFSQGAMLTSVICGMANNNTSEEYAKHQIYASKIAKSLQGVVIISGFISNCKNIRDACFFQTKINIPSMHIYGTSDLIMTPNFSIGLSNQFEKPLVCSHSKGHIIPSDYEVVQKTIRFINENSQISKL